jgi:DNA polymerase III delta prime subunit
MIKDLLFHPKTRMQIENILNNPPHGLLIAGESGSGKQTTAQSIAAELLGLSLDKLQGYAYFYELNPSSDSISIDDIRSLQQFLKLKVPSGKNRDVKRIIIIHGSERMRHEAQNSLLKTLEEPPLDTILILTVNQAQLLLPTISSRVINLEILPVSEKQSTDYFSKNAESMVNIAKFYALSEGQAGLLSALLHEENHPILESVRLAKQIISEPVPNRLKRTDQLAKDKHEVKSVLDALRRVVHAALSASSKQHKAASIKKWHVMHVAILRSINLLKHNPNMKLLLDDLFLNI